MPNYSTLSLASVFMHQIALHEHNGEKKFNALLTDIPVELDARDLGFLTDRFSDALEKRALNVVPSEHVDSPSPGAVVSHLRTADLKTLSQLLAGRLVESQRLNAKTGLLVVADADLDGTPGVLIAKVEHQEAMQAEATTLEGGLRSISIKRIPDLVFGEQTRIYKIAVLQATDKNPVGIQGFLADIQNGGGFANYFLGEFLGLKLADEPEVLTERFLDKMTEAIHQSSLGADEKIEAQAALAVDIKSNSSFVDAESFIRTHIPPSHQQDIRSAASARGVPMMSFTKDPKRISARLNNLRINLGTEISLVAPPHQIGSQGQVRVERDPSSSNGELYDVTIKGVPLESVTNSRPR